MSRGSRVLLSTGCAFRRVHFVGLTVPAALMAGPNHGHPAPAPAPHAQRSYLARTLFASTARAQPCRMCSSRPGPP